MSDTGICYDYHAGDSMTEDMSVMIHCVVVRAKQCE